MQRAEVSYGDHNDLLEPLLPRTGMLSEKKSMAGRDDWHVVTLDVPFTLPDRYQPKQVRYFVIASRWQGHRIDDPEGTSVFLLIPKRTRLPRSKEWTLDQFDHIAWGEVKLLRESPIQSPQPIRASRSAADPLG